MAMVLINETPTEVGSGADEIIRLRAENAALKAELSREEEAHFKTHNWLIDRNEELVAAQADAKRYRWLTNQDADHEIDIASWDGEHWCCNFTNKECVDAAIEAAIAKENGK